MLPAVLVLVEASAELFAVLAFFRGGMVASAWYGWKESDVEKPNHERLSCVVTVWRVMSHVTQRVFVTSLRVLFSPSFAQSETDRVSYYSGTIALRTYSCASTQV